MFHYRETETNKDNSTSYEHIYLIYNKTDSDINPECNLKSKDVQ
jgi:hypothetical protein